MAATDARPIPLKAMAYRVTFPILDADGDLVTGASSLDSEVSKDGGTFTDCTNEATEVASGSGMYYLDLTSSEMDADTVAVIIKTSTSGAKTTPLVLYPAEDGDLRADVRLWLGSAPNALSSGRIDSTVGAMAAGVVTAAAVATDAIDADALAASAVTELQSGLATAGALTTAQTSLSDIQARLPAALLSGRIDASVGAYQSGLTPPTAIENADALLKRDWSSITGEAARSVLNALRFLRNKWSISGTTLTVCKEDDTTAAWAGTVTTNGSADPVTGNDPA